MNHVKIYLTLRQIGCLTAALILAPLGSTAGEVVDVPIVVEEAQVPKGPASKIDKQTHDFGKIKRSEAKRHTFYVTNTGDAPLLILHVGTSCGCTTTSYTTKSIPPGKRGKVVVEFKAGSQPPGPFRKVITIYLNTVQAYTRVFIKGDIQD